MIKTKDVNKELDPIDANTKIKKSDSEGMIVLRNILKTTTLLVKLVRDIKINQTMRKES